MVAMAIMLGVQTSGSLQAQIIKEEEQGKVIDYNGEQYILVKDAYQFLHSIISGQNILVAAQTEINLSVALEDERWWKRNTYNFKWLPHYESENLTGQNIVSEEVCDGRQLCIVGYSDIKIEGQANSRIVVNPRYAFCIDFVNCNNISLRNLIIGHTEGGNCEGGVIGTKGGDAIYIFNCDLYGCGTYGLQLEDTRRFSMYSSNIHDCTYGIMTLNNIDTATFDDCDFYRNREFTLVDSRNSTIAFSRCHFYENNPGSLLFNTNKTFYLNQCYIAHPTERLGSIDWCVIDEGTTFSEYKAASKVSYEGERPTIVDFVNAIANMFMEDESIGWKYGWEKYMKTGKTPKQDTYNVDKRNGFVSIVSRYPDEGRVNNYEFCYWNCADGKHKLVALSNYGEEEGRLMMTETMGLELYRYDNDTQLLTYIGMAEEAFGSKPVESGFVAYQLPRSGKDITFRSIDGDRGTVRWNGNGFTYARNIKELPKSAKHLTAKRQCAILVNKESSTSYSVWVSNVQTQTVELVCTTDTDNTPQWDKMKKATSDAMEVAIDEIGAAVEDAWFCHGNDRKIIVQGRSNDGNLCSYIIDLDSHRAWLLPSLEGVMSIDEENNEIVVSTYSFDDEGRYTYDKVFSTEGKFLRFVGGKARG